MGRFASWNGFTNLIRRWRGSPEATPKRVMPTPIEFAASRLALEPARDGVWSGRRVVQKASDFVLESDSRLQPAGVAPIEIYVVDRIEGTRLLLKADLSRLCGCVEADEVIAFENAGVA